MKNSIHYLKILPEYYDKVRTNEKTFEIRKNDRDYIKGDIVVLREFSKDGFYTFREPIFRKVTYITDFEQKPGFVVFGMQPLRFSEMKSLLHESKRGYFKGDLAPSEITYMKNIVKLEQKKVEELKELLMCLT